MAGAILATVSRRILSLLLLLLPLSAEAETLKGKVVGVTDGDTITVLRYLLNRMPNIGGAENAAYSAYPRPEPRSRLVLRRATEETFRGR